MNINQLLQKLANRTSGILGSEDFTKYAVLIPITFINNEPHLLFEVRAFHLNRQPGEICFPGGKVDEGDVNVQAAAIRETSEELQVDASTITNISPLDYVVTPYGSIIYPFVGVINEDMFIQPNREEVEEIFTVPIDYLMKAKPKQYSVNYQVKPDENFPYSLINGGTQYNWQTRKTYEYFYFYGDKVIWGLTAKILKHFLQLMEED